MRCPISDPRLWESLVCGDVISPLDSTSIDNVTLLSILGFHFSAPLTSRLALFFPFSSLFQKIDIDNKTNKTVFPYSFYSVFSLYTLFLCLIVYIYLKNIVIPTVCGIDNEYRQYIDNELPLSILHHALATLSHTLLTGSLWLFWFLGWVWD